MHWGKRFSRSASAAADTDALLRTNNPLSERCRIVRWLFDVPVNMLGTLNLGLEWMFLAHGSLFLWP